MNPFDRFLESTSRTSFRLLDLLLNGVFSFHSLWFFAATIVGVVFFFAGKRLKRFNHPDRPLLSPFIRILVGAVLYWVGLALCALLVLLALSVGFLTLFGSFSQAGLLRADKWTTSQYYFLRIWPWICGPTIGVVSGGLSGLLLSLYLVLRTIPLRERGQGLRDVRHMSKLFKKMKGYAPQKFVDVSKGIFVGLEDGKHPVYIPVEQFHDTHTQVLGASGSGKGIALGLLTYQFILAGESVILFDPKGDKRLPLVAALAAKKAGKKFWFIDLRPEAPPQFNLIANATSFEIEELLVAGLGLQPTSGDGDYYRGIDQDAAASVAQQVVCSKSPSIATLLDRAREDEEVAKAENFIRRLKQVSQLAAIQTSHDFDFAGILERGDVLYILGSTDNHRVKTLQSMLLIRLLQVIKNQSSGRKTALFLDEFKHLLCSVSLDALGTVRELGCHAILAHQSMGDLGGCPGLRREDVEPRVVDNTTLKLVYRLNDAKASLEFAARSGKQRTHSEGVRGLDDNNQDQRAWSETQQFRVPDDLFTHLHRPSDGNEVVAAGVLFGFKTARLVAVSPINVKGSIPVPLAAPAETLVLPKTAESLI